jgi:hypothetical protein
MVVYLLINKGSKFKVFAILKLLLNPNYCPLIMNKKMVTKPKNFSPMSKLQLALL